MVILQWELTDIFYGVNSMISLAALLVAASKEDSSSVTDSKLKNDEDVLDAYIVWGRGIFSSFLSKGYRGDHILFCNPFPL